MKIQKHKDGKMPFIGAHSRWVELLDAADELKPGESLSVEIADEEERSRGRQAVQTCRRWPAGTFQTSTRGGRLWIKRKETTE